MSRYIDLERYHRVEQTHPFYKEMVSKIISEVTSRSKAKKTDVIELGAGTGLLTQELLKIPSISPIVLEMDSNCVSALKNNLAAGRKIKVVRCDMINYFNGSKFDIAVSSFSHHHAEYDRGLEFAMNINKNLKPKGVYIVGEELIPKFLSEKDRKRSLKKYHSFIIRKAISEAHHEVAELEKAALESGLNKIGDFKRHEKMLEDEMCSSGFKIITKQKIGPINKNVGGVFVYVFQKTN